MEWVRFLDVRKAKTLTTWSTEGGQDRGKLKCILKFSNTYKALSYETLVLFYRLATIKKFTCPSKGSKIEKVLDKDGNMAKVPTACICPTVNEKLHLLNLHGLL